MSEAMLIFSLIFAKVSEVEIPLFRSCDSLEMELMFPEYGRGIGVVTPMGGVELKKKNRHKHNSPGNYPFPL